MDNLRVKIGWLRRLPGRTVTDILRVCRLKKQLESSTDKIVYFGVPEHSNLGDMAQYYCIRRFFEKYYREYTVIDVPSRNYLNNTFGIAGLLRENIAESDLIFFQSGYCTQDLGGREEEMHRAVIRDFPQNRMVILPQTVFFRSEENRQLTARVYNSHPDMLFLARDRLSYKTALQMFNRLPVRQYPDIVTTLIGQYSYDAPRQGVLFCLRNDSEKSVSQEDIKILTEHICRTESCYRLDTNLRIAPQRLVRHLQPVLEKTFAKFSRYRCVVTDRYYGIIFALIANTPVVVLPTKDHKVTTGVEWFQQVYPGRVYLAEDAYRAVKMVEAVLSQPLPPFNEPYFEKEYYAKLRQLIDQSL